MAKKNTKAQREKEERRFQRAILKEFTDASIYVIEKGLKDVDFGDLFIDIFISSEDKDIVYLNKRYEAQLLLSKTNIVKFKDTLHGFYLEMENYIKQNKLYRKFYKMLYIVNVQLSQRDVRRAILDSYQNILLQQIPYFLGTAKYTINGITTKGRLLYTPEPGTNLTEINYEMGLMMSGKSKFKNLQDVFHHYGYPDAETMDDFNRIISRDQIINNTYYAMTYFMDEHNIDLFKQPVLDPTTVLSFHPLYKTDTYNDKELLTKLRTREFLLPSEGLYIDLKNAGSVAELYFTETIVEDSIVLLWRMKNHQGEYIFGYFDTSKEVFYSPWQYSSGDKFNHIPLRRLILQKYLYLTCTLTEEEKIAFLKFIPTKDMTTEIPVPLAFFHYREKVNPRDPVLTRRPFDRAKYLADIISISPFLRNLPKGAVASDEAIETARRLGIILPKGKTIVRGFNRKSWRNEIEE